MRRQMMHFGKPFDALTVADVRKILEDLPDDTVLLHTEWDSEWGHAYHYVLTGVHDGYLNFTMYDTDGEDA